MAVDKTMLDAFLGGYKFYIDDMKNKNITGEYYDEVERLYKRIEELGQECSDMNEFYAKMQNENITVKMSDAYTRALTEEGNKKYMPKDGEIPDDSQLFKNNIDAMRNCIKSLRDSYEDSLKKATESQRMRIMVESNPEDLIKSIEDMIALAEEPGMTYANFLRIQIERGLDKVVEGVVTRKSIEYWIEAKKALMEPEIEIKVLEEKLEEYNKEASKNKFNIVDTHVWNLISDRIERKHQAEIIKRDKIYDLFHKIISDLGFWSIAHCPFAPTDVAPWSMMGNLELAKADIEKTKAIYPGIIREYEKLLYRYFGLRLKDVIRDEKFIHLIKSNYVDDSQELIEHLLLDVYPQCKPFNTLPNDIIEKRSAMYKGNRERNPLRNEPYMRMKRYYNSKFGEGYMEKYMEEIGQKDVDVNTAKVNSSAAPWDLATFIQHTEGKIAEPDLNETFVDNSASAKVDEAASAIKEKAGGFFSFFKR
ncbi:MAG: hypothetical protein J5709_07720 [Bacteroidales bacterium]|nr:hypothetical protein [Bacteroidales bacterium]